MTSWGLPLRQRHPKPVIASGAKQSRFGDYFPAERGISFLEMTNPRSSYLRGYGWRHIGALPQGGRKSLFFASEEDLPWMNRSRGFRPRPKSCSGHLSRSLLIFLLEHTCFRGWPHTEHNQIENDSYNPKGYNSKDRIKFSAVENGFRFQS